MPADFQRLILEDVVPILAAEKADGGEIDALLLAKINACLENPEADLASTTQIGGDLDPAVRTRLARLQNLTGGARALIGGARDMNEALSYIFKDRAFRTYLRRSITDPAAGVKLNRLITGMAAAGEHAPVVGVAKVAPASDVARAAPAKTLPPVLSGYGKLRFTYRYANAEWDAGLPDLLAALSTPATLGYAAAQMAGLAASNWPHVLIHLARLARDGALPVSAEAHALLRLFEARVYLQFNAARSASAAAQSIIDEPEVFKLLSSGEQLRLRNVLARSIMRSGRGQEALDLYKDVLTQNPASANALMNVVGSAFAIDPERARELSLVALANNYEVSNGDLIFIADILTANGEPQNAEAALFRILQREPTHADAFLGLANLDLKRDRTKDWSRHLQRYFRLAAGLDVEIDLSEPVKPFAIRPQGLVPIVEHPRVTVVMTTFNAGPTVERAVNSVLEQVLQNIELIVVDDCSEDDSRERVISLSRRDARVRWLHNDRNSGTYVSKNRGIEAATGDYVTFHDSDDWMHPHRLLRHLEAMRGGYACTTSHWIRMDASGHVAVRRGGPYTHLNPASTFIPRTTFNRIGLFDAVRTGADSEMLTRLRMSFGQRSVVNLPTCLGVGLHHENSLTQSGAAAFDEFRYSPVRLDYTEQWLAWQLEQLAEGPRELLLRHGEEGRAFSIPEAVSPG